ncbi:MAG: InlB B-repeat-containing protein, partial [Bacilli bacterium]|nr:InlB B-repeat-containing protein [Bacilli bacterium]
DIRHSSDGVIVNKTLQINKIDTTNPTVTLSSENKFKQQAQRVNLKCNDSQSGVEKYYFGEKNITSEDDIRTTKKIKNGSLNITTTIDKPGVYYLACKDKAGNWDVTSIKMVKYTVYNMLDKVTESAGTYTANNYKTISTMCDNLIEEGTIGRPDDFYTSPANIGTQVVYKGYRNNPPGTTHSSIIAGTPNIAVVENGNYSFWFDRKTYSITLDSGDGISSVSGAGTYKWGAIATIDAVVKPGYEWDKWTDKNLSLSSSKNYTVAIGTSNVTYKANAKDITKPTVELIGTSKLKSTSQTMTLKCSDKQSGLSAYYFGTTEPTSATDATIVRSDDLTALASASGLSKNITSAGKYWLICKDKTGNYEKKSVTMIGYTVYNMLDKITGTIGVYNTTNYDTSSSTNYITIPGVSGKTSELYTNPGNSVYKGYKNASPGATAITSLSEGDPSIDIATNGKYSFWFDRKTYTITYNVNGGSGTPENQTKKHGGTATISSTIPTRTGYNFLGWGTSSGATTVSYSAGASYTTNANLSLYAIWGIKTYTITYDANDGNGAPSSQTKTHDIALTLSSTKPTRTGYTFLGWNTSKTSTTANSSYAPGKTYGTNANLTLYAVWSANTYTISYNENGGSGAPSSQTKRHGETATLSSTKPTRTGYTFLGWNTSKTSATANSSYAPGKTYGTNADLTLYAVWSINKYTVKFDSDGGSAVSNQTVNYNGKATKPNNPTKTGYTFKEWRLSGSTSAYDFNTSVTKDITLKAVWESACSASNPTACPKLYVCDITSTYFRLNPGYDYVYQGVASVCTSNIYECSDYSNTDIDHDQPFYKLGESGDFYIIYSPFDIYVEG